MIIMKGGSEMFTDLLNSMGAPGLICTVAAVVFVFYCIIKGGKGNGSGNGSGRSNGSNGGSTPPPSNPS